MAPDADGANVERVFRLAPEIPVDRQEREADGDEMLLELEQAERFVEMHLLEDRPDADAIAGIDDGADQRGQQIENDDRLCIGGRAHAAEAGDKIALLTGGDRLPDAERLMGDRAHQRDRTEHVDDEQDTDHGFPPLAVFS